jgi:hypothetical protein
MREILLAGLFLIPFVAGDPNDDVNCFGGGVALGVIQIGGDARATFYVDDRNYALGNGMWFYQESNGVFTPHDVLPPDDFPARWWEWLLGHHNGLDNLQRGGSSAIVPGDADFCDDNNPAGPDTLIF